MTHEPLDQAYEYVAPVGGVVVPDGLLGDNHYRPGHFVRGPISIRDGCPAPLLDDEGVLGHWFVPRTKSSPSEIHGTYVVEGVEQRGGIARSSWYLLLTSRYVRVVGVVWKEAKVSTAGRWWPMTRDGWLAFVFDLRDVTYFSGSRRKVQFGNPQAGFTGTAFMPATPEPPGWTPAKRSVTHDFALDLGRAILQAKRDSGDVDQEGAADQQARTNWESRVVGRMQTGQLSFPVSPSD